MSENRRALRVLLRTGAVLAAFGLLVAARMKDGDLELIADLYGGVYDVIAPASGPGAAGGELEVLRVSSPMVGWHVFYVEEHASDGALLAQRLHSFELAADRKSIIELVFGLKEPRRWEGGAGRADIFKAMIPDDLIPIAGCEVYWVRAPRGFAGHGGPRFCRLRAGADGSPDTMRLTAAELAYGSRVYRRRPGS
jgi:hypothetical protein